jgi:hypothetical protein
MVGTLIAQDGHLDTVDVRQIVYKEGNTSLGWRLDKITDYLH